MSDAPRNNLDPKVKAALIELAIPMVRRVARKLCKGLLRGADFNDMVQTGCTVLSQLVEVYDPKKNDSFEGFTWWRVRGAMIDRYRRDRREKASPLEPCLDAMRRAGGDVAEMVHDGGNVLTDTDEMTQDRIDAAMGNVASGMAVAFCNRAARAAGEEAFIVREEYLLKMRKLEEAFVCLSEQDALILDLRWLQGLNFDPIAVALGVSCPTAHRYYARAFKRLGELLRARGLTRAPPLDGIYEEP